MTGAVMNPVQTAAQVDIPNVRTPAQPYVSTLAISTIVDQLLAHVRSGSRSDNNEIYRLCLNLSRYIDYAVGNNEIPDKAFNILNLLKQVWRWTSDTKLRTAIMVLMISIKGACRNGWFSDRDNVEFHILWNQLSTSFFSVRDTNCEERTVYNSISTVLSRFYPGMKMGEILALIEAMPGYNVFVKDFHITKNAKSPDEQVYLFVAQTDSTETSSCIISPQLVNFLLNGKPVDGRTSVSQDPGPQIPTLVTDLVKDGTNLLQAVGQFNGKYIIVIAFMSMISNPSAPAIPDYTQPVAAATDSDNDIVEGPSRISLNCPISFKRITTPVKGRLCKHLQCFDFDNYAGINSRRPSWRCPHCSQSVCFTDIRIDQGMAKVLKEVDVSISHVSAHGSWEAINAGDDHADKKHDKLLSNQEPTPPSDMGGDILDLTEVDNGIDASNFHQETDKKPSIAQLQAQPNPSDQIPSHVNTMGNRFFRPTYENGTSDIRSHVTIPQGQTVISGFNNMQLPTHAIGTSNTIMNPILQGPSQTQVSASSMQFQQQNMNNVSNDYSLRYMSSGRHVTRLPYAVQALPTQTPAVMVSGNRQQQFSGFQMDQHQIRHMVPASMPENMGSQNWVHHNLSSILSQPAHRYGPSHLSSGHDFNSHQHQPVNHMIPNLVQSPVQLSPQPHTGFLTPTTGHISNQQAHHYVGPTSNQQAHHYVGTTTGSTSNQQTYHYANTSAPQAPQISSWTPPNPALLPTSLSSMHVTSSEMQRGLGEAVRTHEGSANAPAVDPNWRPTGRMRGSLSGRAYTEAFNQAIVHPTQPVLAASPPVLNTPRPFIPPHLQALMGNTINANGFEDVAGGLVLDGASGARVFRGN